jgi:hypothetical protein
LTKEKEDKDPKMTETEEKTRKTSRKRQQITRGRGTS